MTAGEGELAPASASVGFVGLGRMGLPMAANLARSGWKVKGWARHPQRLTGELARHLALVDSPAEAGREVRAIFSALPDLPQLEEVLSGGLLEQAAPGGVLVVMSTVSPEGVRSLGRRLADQGWAVVDAPVSGSDKGAQDASLAIMVGGDSAAVSAIEPALRCLGSRVTHLGPLGSGQLAKACNQVVVATTLVALGEAATLARKGGLDVARVFEALGGGLADSRALALKGPKIASGDFTPGGSATFQLKDLRIAIEEAHLMGAVLPVTAVVAQLYEALCSMGHGEEDHCGVVQVIEALGGAGI
jgi:2-hydroxy-3-oxopropionate reductase